MELLFIFGPFWFQWYTFFFSGQCPPPLYWLWVTTKSIGLWWLLWTVFSSGSLFDSAYDFYFYDGEFIFNDPLVYHMSRLDEVWLCEPEYHACCHKLEEHCCLAEDFEWIRWFDKTPVKPSGPLSNLIDQSLQTNHLHSFSKGRNYYCVTSWWQWYGSLLPITVPEEAPPTYLMLIWMMPL